MARLTRSVAKKTNNFEKIDNEYAYCVWLLEKEFSVGAITDEFLLMKFWNLLDGQNTKRYNRDTTGKSSGKDFKTFG